MSPIRVLAAPIAALALLTSACGSDSPAHTTAAPPETSSPQDTSSPQTDDVRLLEVLDVETGQPTTIADTVTGDRPVLLWFWAPH